MATDKQTDETWREGREEGRSESKKERESSHVGKKALIIIGRIIRE